MIAGPLRDAQQMKQYAWNIPCDFGRCYIDKTNRYLEVCIKEHKYNQKKSILEKSKLVKHEYKEGNRICRKEAKVMQTEPNKQAKQTMQTKKKLSVQYG
jgi:hypothetical protein